MSVRADISQRADIQAFAERMVEKHGLEKADVLNVLKHVEIRQSILDAISRPAESTINWAKYRKIFIQDKRINGGVKFMRENAAALNRAEEEYGVPKEIITAIIGVETYYGAIMGKYRVIDALSTLAFDYPKRSKFFTKELENFLLLANEQGVDPLQPVGSYAGAMGYGQFMPSSYRAYAVDYDGDGVADIWENTTDAIGSVANYFARHGWRQGGVVVLETQPNGRQLDASVLNKSLKPNITAGKLPSKGLSQPDRISAHAKVAPFKFEAERGDEFILGLHNFYVITRYNHSRLYARAVLELSKKISAANTTAAKNS